MTPKKILVIRLSSLGDVVLATSAVKALKKKFPDSHLSFLTKSAYAGVLKYNPHVDEILEYEKIRPLRRAGRTLKEAGYDLVADLHANPRSFLLSHWAKPARILRYDKDIFGRRMMVWFKTGLSSPPRSVSEKYLDALAPLGVPADDRLPEIFTAPEDEKTADELLKECGVGKGDLIIGVNPGGRAFTKKLPSKKYAELCNALCRKLPGARFVLFGDDKDIEDASAVAGAMGEAPAITAGRTSLPVACALVGRCAAFITNDSGLMHVAVALKVPVLAFFGATVPQFGFFPLGEKDRIVQATLKCRPCSLHGGGKCPAPPPGIQVVLDRHHPYGCFWRELFAKSSPRCRTAGKL